MARDGHGLILGKFMPPHAGHEHLVRFGLEFASQLTVMVCSLDREPIPGELRFAWMRELFPKARIVHIRDDLPQEPADHPDFWNIWRAVCQQAAGSRVDYVFASENYGYRLAQELGAQFIPVDIGRQLVPVSGTAIRQRPFAHWDFIPHCVRPYFVRRVCLFGPESVGKSTLARDLARHFRTCYVSEFARGWLDPKQGRCDPDDIPLIARGQMAAEDSLARNARQVLFCDTDPLLTTIWSEVLFGSCPDWLRQMAHQRRYDLHLLLDIDAPWIDDQQRYLPHRRREFFERCRQALDDQGRRYVVVSGDWATRFEVTRQAVESLLNEGESGAST